MKNYDIIQTEKACKRLEYSMKASAHALVKFNEAYSKLPKEVKRYMIKTKYRRLIFDLKFRVKTIYLKLIKKH